MEKTTYVFSRDYDLAGKKKGDKISMAKVPQHLKKYLVEEGKELAVDEEEEENQNELSDAFPPDESWANPDIIDWLSAKGVDNASGTKAELLKQVKKVLKNK
jgi:hypothetical protein